jgi:hypothetical protein
MKFKLALAACLAALVIPAAPAMADEGIKGTCYETTVPGGTTTHHECECLVGTNGVIVSPPPPTITITYCHAGDPIGNGL